MSTRRPPRPNRLWLRIRSSAQARWGRYHRHPDRYWNLRHLSQQEHLDGVGQIGLGHEANEADYREKWRHLGRALDDAGVTPPARVLDAGCGIGWISQQLVERGHEVTGVDFSAEAVRLAARRLPPSATTLVQPLTDPVPGHPFAAVVCIDVLFHIVDDAIWADTVANLAAMALPAGHLVVQERLVEDDDDDGAWHVRWRALADYERALPGWKLVSLDSYRLPNAGTTKQLMVWGRPLPPVA